MIKKYGCAVLQSMCSSVAAVLLWHSVTVVLAVLQQCECAGLAAVRAGYSMLQGSFAEAAAVWATVVQ